MKRSLWMFFVLLGLFVVGAVCPLWGNTIFGKSTTNSRKLTINGNEIFLLEVSYFNPYPIDTDSLTNFLLLEHDLTLFKQNGFNCIRVSALEIGYPIFFKNTDGAYEIPADDKYYRRLNKLIDICDELGIVIDFTLFIYDPSFYDMPKSLTEAKNFLSRFTSDPELSVHKNWFWDVFNELAGWPSWWGAFPQDWAANNIDGVTGVAQELLAQVKSVDAERLCTASSNSTTSSFLNLTNLNIIAPHTEHCGWTSKQGFGSKALFEEFRLLAPEKPIHLQEPPRRGYRYCNSDEYFPPAERFINDLIAIAQQTDAAGWCFHNHKTCRTFDFNPDWSCTNGAIFKCSNLNENDGLLLTGGPSGYGQLEDVEKDVINAAAGIINYPLLSVIAPNGGENWAAGSSHNITWSSNGSIIFVKIEYSINNGSSWNLISDQASNNGSYSWTVPGTPSTSCLVRVSRYSDAATNDVSYASFTISAGAASSVTVTSPNGGESWTTGSSYYITWSSTGTIANVNIDYSINNGSSWLAVAANTANDGTQAWTVPAMLSANCLVRVMDADNSATVDSSNSVFSIVQAQTLPAPTYTAAMFWLNAFGLESGWNVDEHPRLTADVNGDGKADIVGFAVEGVYVSLGTGTGFTAPQRWVVGFGGEAGWYSGWHIRTMADVNGDGKADVVGFGSAGMHVSLSTGTSFSGVQFWSSSFGNWAQSGGWEINQHPRYMADVNGDGKMDVVGFYNDGVYVALSTGSAFAAPQKWVNGFGVNDGWNVYDHPRALADVNGDGKADVVGFGNSGALVALSNGAGFAAPVLWVGQFGYNQSWYSQHPRLLADVNGDGKKDVVGFYYDGVYVSLSTGTGFSAMQKWVNGYGSSDGWNWNKPRFLADANDDGKDDVIGFGTDGVRVSLSTGAAFTSQTLVVNNFGTDAGGWSETFYPRTVADINGDHKVDVVGFGGYGVWVSLSTTATPSTTYIITASAGAGGTISPAGNVTVTRRANQAFTIAADPGYKITSVTVDGVAQSGAAGQAAFVYPFQNVIGNHAIAAQFEINSGVTYTVTVAAGANGSITPGTSTFNAGTNAAFSVQPSTGYKISQILLDGSALSIASDSGQSVPINDIQANHTLSATFAVRTFTISIAIDGYWNGGTTNPVPGTYTVNYGSNFTITATPNAYQQGKDMTVDGVFQNFLPVVSFTNITANHTYYVRFRGL